MENVNHSAIGGEFLENANKENEGGSTKPCIPELKIVIVGDSGVGKTTYIEKHTTGVFHKKQVSTLDTTVYPMKFDTNLGEIIFNVWEIPGQWNLENHTYKTRFLTSCQGLLLMFDMDKNNAGSINSITRRYGEIRRIVGPEIPVVLVGNKADLVDDDFQPRCIEYLKKKLGCQFVRVSAKTTQNYIRPFEILTENIVQEFISFLPLPFDQDFTTTSDDATDESKHSKRNEAL